MVETRTLKTLVALLAAMTTGAIVLWLMSGDPIPPADLAAVTEEVRVDAVVFSTDKALEPARWRHVIIHAAPTRDSNVARRCHFLVTGAGVEATARWRQQGVGQGVPLVPDSFNTESISICLVGDFSRTPPPAKQFKALVRLTQLLQGEPFSIGAGHVYLRSDLDTDSDAPGLAFPVDRFSIELLR